MGTDIHMRAEKRNKFGKWEAIGPIFKNSAYDWYKALAEKKGVPVEDEIKSHPWIKEYSEEPYTDRNYTLFAILANVRNSDGSVEIIDEPRGLPDDMSPELKAYFDCDYYHSMSYVTLQELVDYNWKKPSTHTGYLTEKDYINYTDFGIVPNNWCGAVGGPGIVTVNAQQMNGILMGSIDRNEESQYYVLTTFTTGTISEYVGSFCSITIPTLCKVSVEEEIDPKDIRIVFGFDS